MAPSLIVSKVPDARKCNNTEVLVNVTGKGFVLFLFVFVLARNTLTLDCTKVCIIILSDQGSQKMTIISEVLSYLVGIYLGF